MTPGKEGPPTKKDLEGMIQTCDAGSYPFFGNSGSVGRIARYALKLHKALEEVRDEIGDCHHGLIAQEALNEGKS